MGRFTHSFRTYTIAFVLLLALGYLALVGLTYASLERDWSRDQALLARAEIAGDSITIHNIRNIDYRSTTDYDVRYYDKTFDLEKIESLWYMVEPFKGHGAGAAHTLVSFGFEGGDYVAISAEIRKEKGESFSPIHGVLRQYEIVYVIADERDVIKLRSNYRKNDVFLYPVEMSKENIQRLFVSMLERANSLATEPEFYNTITNTCATNIVEHINDVVPERIRWSHKILMPALSDEVMREYRLIDDSLPIEGLRAKYRINEKALQYADDPRFSERIRE
jgi:hypothetical protein